MRRTRLVKFLLALTDPRVKYERAPFDQPEIFVPIDGLAGDNTPARPTWPAIPCSIRRCSGGLRQRVRPAWRLRFRPSWG